MSVRELTVLEWAIERLGNTQRLAAMKTGDDRAGWLEDAEYWMEIVAVLMRASPCGYCQTCREWKSQPIGQVCETCGKSLIQFDGTGQLAALPAAAEGQ